MKFKTITVGELRELLADQDDDRKVIFTSNYGDRGQTQQAHGICGLIDEVTLEESAYSDSGYAVKEEDPDPAHIYEPYLVIK